MFHFVPKQQSVELSIVAVNVCQRSASPLLHLSFASDKDALGALAVRSTCVLPTGVLGFKPDMGGSTHFSGGNCASVIKYCFPHILV